MQVFSCKCINQCNERQMKNIFQVKGNNCTYHYIYIYIYIYAEEYAKDVVCGFCLGAYVVVAVVGVTTGD